MTALGILVGGGPAPGLNGVISAATIEARRHGVEVFGFLEGFKYLIEGNTTRNLKLESDQVADLYLRGGALLQTSRANPTKNPEHLARVIDTLQQLGVRYLLTCGGDDTAHSASRVAAEAEGKIAVAHVPKTIDNDLPLSPGVPTFGYETARETGAAIGKALLADARTAPRWYLAVAMGRAAGFLALGIGKSAGAQLILIPEEWEGQPVTFGHVCDLVEASILKCRAEGQEFGLCVMAEGLMEHMSEAHLEETFGRENLIYDDHGHIRLDDLELGKLVRDELRKRFEQRGLKVPMVYKNIGYELRCTDPNAFDREYTRDLGCAAVQFLLAGNSGAVITIHENKVVPMQFADMRDPNTGRPRTRKVDINSDAYKLGRSHTVRLQREDLQDPERLQRLAQTAKMSAEEFQKRFAYLLETP